MRRLLTIMASLIVLVLVTGCSQEATESAAAAPAPTGAVEATAVDDTGETFVADIVRHDYAAHQTRDRVWADYVRSASGGRIVVNELSRDAIASADTDLLELLRAGEVTMGSIAERGVSDIFPGISALGVPFIIPNAIVAQTMLGHDSPFFEILAEEIYRGSNGEVRLVGAHVNSFRNFYSRYPVRTPADLRQYNVTIRVQELPMIIAVWEALGAAAIGLPAGDRYMALETGLIDALEGGLASVYQTGAFGIIDYATMLGYMFSGNYMLVNEQWYQSLPPALQQVVRDGWAKAMWMETQVREFYDLQEMEALLAEGNTVIVPSEAELAQWREIAVPTAREFLEDEIDTSWIDVVQEHVERAQTKVAAMSNTIGRQFD